MNALSVNSQGVFLGNALLIKRSALQVDEKRLDTLLKVAYGKKIPLPASRYIKRAAELLAEVSDAELENGIVHETVIYDYNKIPAIIKLQIMLALSGLEKVTHTGRERLNKAAALLDKNTPSRRTRELLKALLKDDDDGDGEEGDEDSEDDEGSDNGTEGGDHDSDFDEKHPRWPAGSTDGTSDEFRAEG